MEDRRMRLLDVLDTGSVERPARFLAVMADADGDESRLQVVGLPAASARVSVAGVFAAADVFAASGGFASSGGCSSLLRGREQRGRQSRRRQHRPDGTAA